MRTRYRILTAAVLAGALSACDSSDDDAGTPLDDPGAATAGTAGGTDGGATTAGAATAGGGTQTAGGTDTGTTAGGTDAGGGTTAGAATAGGGTQTAGGTDTGTTAGGTDTGGTDTGTTDGGTDTGGAATAGGTDTGTTDGGTTTAGGTDTGGGAAPPPPEGTSATAPLLTPTADDFFFVDLEVDPEAAVRGGPPTQPKNLRIDLVSNDWAEFSWAPSNDDGAVVQYNVRRSDGVTYRIRGDDLETYAETLPSSSLRALDRHWRTTSFVDCNYTRFSDRPPYNCETNGPSAGETYTYEVTAVDDEGNESPASNPITIEYPAFGGAAVVPEYADPYLDPTPPVFARSRDLSRTESFLDAFTLVFEDEFDGTAIDERLWNTELLWGDDFIINGEEQYFVDTQAIAAGEQEYFVDPTRPNGIPYDPFRVANSTLTIEAVPTPAALADDLPDVCDAPYADGRQRCSMLSGALATHDKFNLTYGYVEARMKPGTTPGALTSFYLFHRYPGEGRNFHAPEIDIVEAIAANRFTDERNLTSQNYHFADTALHVAEGEELIRRSPTMYYQDEDGGESYGDDWHTYGVLWEPQLVVWYVDGREVRRLFGPQVGRRAMNVVLYLVTGSGWAVTPDLENPDAFPITLEVDWIRAYQRGGYVGNGLYPLDPATLGR